MIISPNFSRMAAVYWAGITNNYPAPPLKSNLAVRMVYYRLMEVSTNPFAVMSLIVAPAILTNACSVLVMSTSNRLARAVDRARELAKQLEGTDVLSATETAQLLDDLAANETRALLLLSALQGFYSSLSGFAAAALISLIGAVLASVKLAGIVQVLAIVTVLAGSFAVGSLIFGAILLLRETRLAVQLLRDRAARIRKRKLVGDSA